MTATVPSVPTQPATPAMDLREKIGYLVFRAAELMQDRPMRPTALQAADDILREVRAEADAAPAVYALPAEPEGPLWYPDGTRLDRFPPPHDGYSTHTWAPAGGSWYSGLRWDVLLSVAAGRVLDAAREWCALWRAGSVEVYAAAATALAAAVDALDGGQPAEPGPDQQAAEAFNAWARRVVEPAPGWCTVLVRHTDINGDDMVPCGNPLPCGDHPAEPGPERVECACGVPIVHATPDGYGADGCDDPIPADHQQLHEALSEAERRAEAAEDRAATASAERQWAADGVCRRCGHGLSGAEPAPEPDSGPGLKEAAERIRILCGEVADAQHDARVADQKLEAARDERDAARAELAEMERVREIDRESTLKLLRQHEADRAELAEVTAERDQQHAAYQRHLDHVSAQRDRAETELAEVTADRDRARDAMPEGITGYHVQLPDGTDLIYDPADVTVVIRPVPGSPQPAEGGGDDAE